MNLEDLVNNVILDVPDCPLMTIRQEIMRSSRKFCTDADAWVERDKVCVAMVTTKTGAITPPSYGEPIRLNSLTLDGDKVRQGRVWKQVDPGTVEFTHTPSETILKGDLVMRPHPNKMPPEEIIERWSEAFEDGARGRLLLMPQPWRDSAMAEFYLRRREEACSEAKQASRLGHGQGRTRVTQRRFM